MKTAIQLTGALLLLLAIVVTVAAVYLGAWRYVMPWVFVFFAIVAVVCVAIGVLRFLLLGIQWLLNRLTATDMGPRIP